MSSTTQNVGASPREERIIRLLSATYYEIEVAAMNSAGTGVYSGVLTLTLRENFKFHIY